MKVFVRISITEGGSTGVATVNRASGGAAALPSAPLVPWRLRHFIRPLKVKASKVQKTRRHFSFPPPRGKAAPWILLTAGTRNPDVLSRRQRRRQQKLRSREKEFWGMFWSHELTGSLLPDPSAQKQERCGANIYISHMM